MLAGFALYNPAAQPRSNGDGPQLVDDTTIATPPGTRLMRIIRLPRGWRLWTATRDYVFGSYLELFEDGRILNVTTRVDEGDEMFWSRPPDKGYSNG
jgi:hypothetical protein